MRKPLPLGMPFRRLRTVPRSRLVLAAVVVLSLLGLGLVALGDPGSGPGGGAAARASGPNGDGGLAGRPGASGKSEQGSAADEPVVSVVSPKSRDQVLAPGWRTSADVAWTTSGDGSGFHLLVAQESTAYAWRTVATLRETDVEADQWIGNACLTGSGRSAVVVYAPRAFVNETEPSQRGGYTAVVDLASGAVTKLPVRSSLAYFSPGCGAGETAVITQERLPEGDSPASPATRLFVVDASTKRLGSPMELAGQVTSAVPVASGVVAAAGRALVTVDQKGRMRQLAAAESVPYDVTADAAGGVVFMDQAKGTARVRRLAKPAPGGQVVDLARGELTKVDIASGAGGRVFVTGAERVTGTWPEAVSRLQVPENSEVSSLGHLAILPQQRAGLATSKKGAASPSSAWQQQMTVAGTGEVRRVRLHTKVVPTGGQVDFSFDPGVRPAQRLAEGSVPHPLGPTAQAGTAAQGGGGGSGASGGSAGGGSAGGSASSQPTQSGAAQPSASDTQRAYPAPAGEALSVLPVYADPVDSSYVCAVPRNDAKSQVYQPTPRQVEWAVDQAVMGTLTTARPANWKQSGLPSYSPQGLQPPIALDGGGHVPPQIMLGILAQESNLWQASWHALPGMTGNPLVSNFYGRKVSATDDSQWNINYAGADCGYGVAQVTDGMRLKGYERANETALPATTQRAIAVDYATNIAAGLRILQDKWNQTRAAGIIHNNGDPQSLENWFFAVWAYNSGLHKDNKDGLPWGLGWANNPANPRYPVNRTFFNKDPKDAKNPQWWPYPERVMGWAAFSITTVDGAGFRYAWWASETDRLAAKPPVYQFCTIANECDMNQVIRPDAAGVASEPPGPCGHRNASGQYDLLCWWHWPTTFNDCSNGHCGHEVLRFDSTYAEQPDGTNSPPPCAANQLPSGALVIDDVPASVPSVRPKCSTKWANSGTFSLEFFRGTQDATLDYPSKIDFHQVGAGFGGHYWFAHTRQLDSAQQRRMEVIGTWTLNKSLNGWARVLVHIPEMFADTQQARYEISLGNGKTKVRYALQNIDANTWVNLGVMQFAGVPKITLSSHTGDGSGDDAIAWDAVAFVPMSKKPKQFVVAMGDSWSSGEGVSDLSGGNYFPESDYDPYDTADNPAVGVVAGQARNLCHRSKSAWSRLAYLSDAPSATIGARSDSLDPTLDYQFLACSGAQTKNIIPNGEHQYPEMPQIDKGYLDENTTLITISIGGNDAGFGGIVQNCLLLPDCPHTILDLADRRPMAETVPSNIDNLVQQRLIRTLTEIHTAAPNARIALVGYPRAFPGAPSWASVYASAVDYAAGLAQNSCGGLNSPPYNTFVDGVFSLTESSFLNSVSDDLNAMNKRVADTLRAQNINVVAVDPSAAFANNGLCSANPAFHSLIVKDKTDGEAKLLLENGAPFSQQSFHPNYVGAQLYANALNDTLRSMGL